MDLLKKDGQSAWVLLSASLSSQLEYLLTLQYPSDVLEIAADVDGRIWQALEQLSAQAFIPRGQEGGGYSCVALVPRVPCLQGRSFQ